MLEPMVFNAFFIKDHRSRDMVMPCHRLLPLSSQPTSNSCLLVSLSQIATLLVFRGFLSLSACFFTALHTVHTVWLF